MVRVSCLLTCCLLGALILIVPTAAYPSASNYYRPHGQYENEDILDMMNRLNNLLELERRVETFKEDIANSKDDIANDKRALDLGLNRGYSGALQAKHLMGIAAANFAGGPGRRRRDTH
ncbi:unnamed protein product, partial [Brenthis ino]